MTVWVNGVRINEAGLSFSCPACGVWIDERDLVYTLPVSALVRWPVCEECGASWLAERVRGAQL